MESICPSAAATAMLARARGQRAGRHMGKQAGKGASRRELLAVFGGLLAVACDNKAGGIVGAPADAGGKPDAGAVGQDAAAVGQDAATVVDVPVAADTGPTPDAAPETATAKPDTAAVAANPKPAPITPITPNESHYITSCCQLEKVDGKTWKLSIQDHGKEITAFTLAELEALPAKTKEHTLECIGTGPYGQAISNAIWTGLPLQELLATRGLTVPKGTFIQFLSADKFTTALPASDLAKPIWVVWRMNGQPLPHDHGFPARMLIPNRYGMKNPKWVQVIDLTDDDYKGFWEKGGWSNSAEYLPNAFIREPRGDVPLKAGLVQAVGTAYCGSDQVVADDVRVDKGPWTKATIDYGPGPDIWAVWHYDFTLKAGKHTLQARCTTKSGKMSYDDPAGSNPSSGAGYDGSMEVEIVLTA